jgi:hypothetical protein
VSDEQQECTHRWQACPVHSLPDGRLPGMRTVLTCLYGGVMTKAGTPWDEHDSDEVVKRVADRLWP